MFGIWVWKFWLYMFVDTNKTLAGGECFKNIVKMIKNIIFRKNEQINYFILFFYILEFFFV